LLYKSFIKSIINNLKRKIKADNIEQTTNINAYFLKKALKYSSIQVASWKLLQLL